MSTREELAAAVEVFRELGWVSARVEDAEHLPLGTPEQRRTARTGLRSGEWGEFAYGRRGYQWVSHVGVDEQVLALFALRVGVDAPRCVRILTRRHFPVRHDLLARLLAPRGPAFATRFVEAAARPTLRTWEGSLSTLAGVMVTLVDEHDLPVPDSIEYLRDWCTYAAPLLAPEVPAAPLPAGVHDPAAPRPTDHTWIDPVRVLRRVGEHVRAAVSAGVPATGPLGTVLPAAVRHGLLPREEGVALTVAALDAATRPADRVALVRLLTGPLAVTPEELVARADALVPAIAQGEPAVVEALAPALIAGVPDDLLPEVLTVALLVRTRKAQRLLLTTAAARPRPADDVAEAVAPLVLPFLSSTDRALARAATAVVRAWDVPQEPQDADDVEVRGLWRPTPPRWDVPRFDVGDTDVDALTAAAALLTRRPEGRAVDVEVERFLAIANAVARQDRDAARTALAGVRGQWTAGLRCVPAWVAGGASPLADRPANLLGSWPQAAVVHDPLDAREAAVVARLGEVPVLLSTPTWVDLRIDPADLVVRLRAYAAAGASVAESDLYLALTRTDVTLATDEVRSQLEALDVPVLLTGTDTPGGGVRSALRRVLGRRGDEARQSAGRYAARYLTDPFADPGLRRVDGWRHWEPNPIATPGSLAGLPGRVRDGFPPAPEAFPTWGDTAALDIGAGDGADAGLRLRQAARRATPLPPGLAVNLVGAQRAPHVAAAPDASAAVVEAWERGLLVPGVADLGLLGWAHTPANLAGLARVADELAEEGMLSVVWPLLDDALAASAGASRLLAGTAEVAETVLRLLPEVAAAVTAGVAPAAALDVPGARALGARAGSSRAVVAARAVVGALPPAGGDAVPPVGAGDVPPVGGADVDGPGVGSADVARAGRGPEGPAAAPTRTGPRTFDEVWPDGAGTRPAVVDGAELTVVPSTRPRATYLLDLRLPDGSLYRVDKRWFYDLEHEGQCEAGVLTAGAPGSAPPEPNGRSRGSWLRWDATTGRLVVSPHRDWRARKDGPLSGSGPVPPLTTSMVAVLLLQLCHDNPPTYEVLAILRRGLVGSASVTLATRQLLTSEHVSPARLVRLLDAEPTTLPVLWPVLVESLRHAPGLDGAPPRWVHRVLDVALRDAAHLREAADRGLLPADAAAWPGLRDLATSSPSAAVRRKAAALAEQVLPTPDAPQPGP